MIDGIVFSDFRPRLRNIIIFVNFISFLLQCFLIRNYIQKAYSQRNLLYFSGGDLWSVDVLMATLGK